MKTLKLLFSILLLLSSGLSGASGIDKMFVHRSAEGESLFFIFSQKLPADKQTKSTAKYIEYDYTYLQRTDSVSMLMTLSLPKTVKGMATEISVGQDICSYVPELIYADPKKGKIIYRYRIVFPFDWFEGMYESMTPFSVSFHYRNQDVEEALTFQYDERKWLNNREKMNSIIDLIKLNTRKQ